MRLTVNLEPDLYAVAISLAKAEDCSISAAVNQLLRRALAGGDGRRPQSAAPVTRRNGIIVSKGREVVTADTVRRAEAEDDEQGSAQVTDAWLAELARRRGGRLATLDSACATLHGDVATLLPRSPKRET